MQNDILKQFPAVTKFNNQQKIYFDTAATSLTPESVIAAITEYYQQAPISNHSGYDLAMDLDQKIRNIRQAGSELLKASRYHHVFVNSATDGFNKISLMYSSILTSRDTILLSLYEHHANFLPWLELSKKIGFKVIFFNPNDSGFLNLNDLQKLISTYNPKLLAITRCSNINGYTPNMESMSKLCLESEVDLIIDATQFIPLEKENLDVLSPTVYINSWHKAYGPKGIGSIFIKKSSKLNNSLGHVGGAIVDNVTTTSISYLPAPQRFEPGTANFASILGLAPTFEFLKKVYLTKPGFNELSRSLYHQLNSLNYVKLVPATNPDRGIFSFQLDKCNSFDIEQYLNSQGIMVRSGRMCAHPILEHFGFSDVIRVSLGVYNQESEVLRLTSILEKAYNLLKSE